MDKLKNLLELRVNNANEYSDFDPFLEMDQFVAYDFNRKKIIKLPNNIVLKKFKNYRFYDDKNKRRLYMFLPDRNYGIGTIKYFYNDYDTPFDVINIDVSIIHDRFRGKGLGKIMYEYFFKQHHVVESDRTLTRVSYHLWKDLLPEMFPSGILYAVRDGDIMIFDANNHKPNQIDNLLFFIDKKYVPEELKHD